MANNSKVYLHNRQFIEPKTGMDAIECNVTSERFLDKQYVEVSLCLNVDGHNARFYFSFENTKEFHAAMRRLEKIQKSVDDLLFAMQAAHQDFLDELDEQAAAKINAKKSTPKSA